MHDVLALKRAMEEESKGFGGDINSCFQSTVKWNNETGKQNVKWLYYVACISWNLSIYCIWYRVQLGS